MTMLDRFASLGSSTGDDDQTRLEKRVFVLATTVYGVLGAIWASIYLALGLTVPALIPYGYVGMAIVVLTLFAKTGVFVPARRVVLTAWLLLPLLLQAILGGFVPASAVVLWGVAAPLGALIFAPEESTWWSGGFLLAIGVAGLIDPFLEPALAPRPEVARVFFAMNLGGVGIAMFLVMRDFLVRLQQARADLHRERERSERLLLNMLPAAIAQRLKDSEEVIADRLDDVTILFADLVGFTAMAQRLPAGEVVSLLADLVADFDRLARRHGLEKIRTQGDAYMAVAGAPDPRPDHAGAAAGMALEMLEITDRHLEPGGHPLQLRIGIDRGPVVAGVIGLDKYVYDVWGDTVNTASRMESHGVPGRIHVSAAVYERLRDSFELEPRGVIDVKGMGQMTTYFLIGRRPSSVPVPSSEPDPSRE